MRKGKVFWDYFRVTGNIGAYLLFKEMHRNNNYITSGILATTKKSRKLG